MFRLTIALEALAAKGLQNAHNLEILLRPGVQRISSAEPKGPRLSVYLGLA
jgi:hypothetical protein